MANGEIGKEAEAGLDSANSGQSSIKDAMLSKGLKIDTGSGKKKEEIPTDVILTLSTSI